MWTRGSHDFGGWQGRGLWPWRRRTFLLTWTGRGWLRLGRRRCRVTLPGEDPLCPWSPSCHRPRCPFWLFSLRKLGAPPRSPHWHPTATLPLPRTPFVEACGGGLSAAVPASVWMGLGGLSGSQGTLPLHCSAEGS